ncbi:Smr/MutS family protein [Shewanella zhangzhouensis]|uniref:Smr/MutS family protein n=1 Tax=Shewanella zhangzhouensis TaxID=2864213 RepID=UPI001C65D304|nr:Smr/MutS family protein [Shewanella zhangzhouensis]QYK03483.1 Smr/MutS family protein [Shewanella zhangzhouensis]
MQREELDLFMAEMADVTPLKEADRHHFLQSTCDDEAAKMRRDAADSDERLDLLPIYPAELTRVRGDEVVSFSREGVQEAVLKQLRLGRYEAKVRHDFRGLKLKEARALLLGLIDSALFRGDRNLLLIPGKGSGNQPFEALMKSALCTWLSRLDDVSAYHSAIKEEGGAGALYVMLRKSDAAKVHSRETNRKGARR